MFEEVSINCKYAYALVNSKSHQDNSSLESQKKEFLNDFFIFLDYSIFILLLNILMLTIDYHNIVQVLKMAIWPRS